MVTNSPSHQAITINEWVRRIRSFFVDASSFNQAFDLLTQVRNTYQSSVDNHYFNGIEIASVLFDIKANQYAVASGLLTSLYVDDVLSYEYLQQHCHPSIADILNGVASMALLRQLHNPSPSKAQIDKFKRMLLSLVKDVRIVLVKLAERLVLLRNRQLNNNPVDPREAKEIIDIYAPLANRLGVYAFKWELEDRAFAILKPENYYAIARSLGMTRQRRKQRLNQYAQKLRQCLNKQGLSFQSEQRAKHIYSIYKKMEQKGASIEAIHDLHALRIITKTISECYQVLGIANELWTAIGEEFTDHIATPKPNGYQSIHAVYYVEHDFIIELQIRTQTMHEKNETGVAAHWRYKEGAEHDPGYEAKIIWLRTLLEWQSELAKYEDYAGLKTFHNKAITENIYAFTPQGDVIDLPVGSTVLDFAYHVHTMVGHRCKGAKVNDKIVPLTTKLKSGDKVSILTHKYPQPSKDWAIASKGYLSSSKTRNKVARWFRKQNKEQLISAGRYKLTEALKGYRLDKIDYQVVARHFNLVDENDLFASIGSGHIRFNALINYILAHYSLKSSDEDLEKKYTSQQPVTKNEDKHSDFIVEGMNNVLANPGRCCCPVRGDTISGYITQTKGVTVHRRACSVFQQLIKSHPERKINVKWQNGGNHVFPVEIKITADVRQNAYYDIMTVLASEKVTITHSKNHGFQNSSQDQTIKIGMMVKSLEHLNQLINKVKSIKSVIQVKRA